MALPFVARDVFAELTGFVLLDLTGLDAFFGGSARGVAVLARMTQTLDGDRVCEQGIAVPALGVEAGEYDLVLRSSRDPSPLEDVLVTSQGWTFHSREGRAALCAVGWLHRFDPDAPAVRHVELDPGWYQVTIRGGRSSAGGWTIEWVLARSAEKPAFAGRVDVALDLDPSG